MLKIHISWDKDKNCDWFIIRLFQGKIFDNFFWVGLMIVVPIVGIIQSISKYLHAEYGLLKSSLIVLVCLWISRIGYDVFMNKGDYHIPEVIKKRNHL